MKGKDGENLRPDAVSNATIPSPMRSQAHQLRLPPSPEGSFSTGNAATPGIGGVGVTVGSGTGVDVAAGVVVAEGCGSGVSVGSGSGVDVAAGVGGAVGCGSGVSVGCGRDVGVGSGTGVGVGCGNGVEVGVGVGTGLTLISAVAVLLSVRGSLRSNEVTSTTLEMVVPPDPGRTITSISIVWLTPGPRLPTSHRLALLMKDPWLDVAEAKIRFSGSISVTITPEVNDGPSLWTVMV